MVDDLSRENRIGAFSQFYCRSSRIMETVQLLIGSRNEISSEIKIRKRFRTRVIPPRHIRIKKDPSRIVNESIHQRSKSSDILYDMSKTMNSSTWSHTWFRTIVLSHGNGDLVNEGGSKSMYSNDSHPIGKNFEF